jgi:hypothetical protein
MQTKRSSSRAEPAAKVTEVEVLDDDAVCRRLAAGELQRLKPNEAAADPGALEALRARVRARDKWRHASRGRASGP